MVPSDFTAKRQGLSGWWHCSIERSKGEKIVAGFNALLTVQETSTYALLFHEFFS